MYICSEQQVEESYRIVIPAILSRSSPILLSFFQNFKNYYVVVVTSRQAIDTAIIQYLRGLKGCIYVHLTIWVESFWDVVQ